MFRGASRELSREQLLEAMAQLADIDELTRIMEKPDDPHSPGFHEDERHEGNGERQIDIRIGSAEQRDKFNLVSVSVFDEADGTENGQKAHVGIGDHINKDGCDPWEKKPSV